MSTRHPLHFLLLLALILQLFHFELSFAANGGFAGGDGTGGDPYQIEDCLDLQAMSNSLSSSYVLINNINCAATSTWNAGAGFAPVGTPGSKFTGSLDGNGYAISNLTINRSGSAYTGLFGWVNTAGTITEVGLVNATVSVSAYSAPLIGWLESGTVSKTYSTGTVTSASAYVGGLVGSVQGGTLINSYSTASVTNSSYAGGLVGIQQGGTVQYSYATGSVPAGLGGGLIGLKSAGTTTDCFYDSTTSGKSDNSGKGTPKTTAQMKTQSTFTNWTFTVAGNGTIGTWIMAGYPHLQMEHRTTITSAVELQLMAINLDGDYTIASDLDATALTNYLPMGTIGVPFTGSLDGNGYSIANLVINQPSLQSVGIIGYSDGATITEVAYLSGSVTGNQFSGGIVGYSNNGSVSKSYSLVAVTSTNTDPSSTEVGGLIGVKTGGTVSDCYATGTITTTFDGGGLIGYNSGTISRCYASGSVNGGNNLGGLIGRAEVGAISNSFATTTVGSASSGRGGLVGSLSGGASLSGSYWNSVSGGPTNCYSTGNTGCTAVSNNVSYFYEVTNAPMTSWTFPGTWLDANISFPTLAIFGDITVPQLSSFFPADGSLFGDSSGNLVLTFSETMVATTGNVTIYNSDGSVFETIDVSTGKVTGSGTTTITINPANTFIAGARYYVFVDATAFDDAAGNGYAGISNTSTWDFFLGNQTSDSTPAIINQKTPSNGAVDVAVDSVLQLEFNEVVYFGIGSIEIHRVEDDSLFESIAIHGGQVSGFGSRLVRITPSRSFEMGVDYYVTFPRLVFKDNGGNAFPGLSSSSEWSFTTVSSSTDVPVKSEIQLASLECSDLPSTHWATELIQALLSEQAYPVFETEGEVLCRPNDAITRGEFIDWMVKVNFSEEFSAYTVSEDLVTSFSDLTVSDPYFVSILYAKERGLIQGYPDQTVRSSATISRAEILKITLLSLALFEVTEDSVSALELLYPTKKPDLLFADVTSSEEWYYPYLYYSAAQGVIKGRKQSNSEAVYADMSAPAHFAEAGKILYMFKQD